MAVILSIEASTTGCSVAIQHGKTLLASIETKEERSAASLLTTMIADVVKIAQVTLKDIDAVAVCKGPGSYTGLRVAVSTAKGLAMALDKPLLSINTLELLLQQVSAGTYSFIIPMIDARRLEVYSCVYNINFPSLIADIEAVIIDENSYAEYLKEGKCLFIGEGAPKCKAILVHENAIFNEELLQPWAKYGIETIWQKYQRAEFEDLETFEPFYLKEYMFKTKMS